MRLVCTSDTHLRGWPVLPDGDVLIHAGDATLRGSDREIAMFVDQMAAEPHRNKIFVPGNHDWGFQWRPEHFSEMLASAGITCLIDESAHIDGVHFYGSPWQPWFNSWAFNLPRGAALRDKWSRIPFNTDVLVTHGPPWNMLDLVERGEHVGCEELRGAVDTVVKPRVHVFGHIHGQYGSIDNGTTLFVNASACNENYDVVNAPVVIDWAGAIGTRDDEKRCEVVVRK